MYQYECISSCMQSNAYDAVHAGVQVRHNKTLATSKLTFSLLYAIGPLILLADMDMHAGWVMMNHLPSLVPCCRQRFPDMLDHHAVLASELNAACGLWDVPSGAVTLS